MCTCVVYPRNYPLAPVHYAFALERATLLCVISVRKQCVLVDGISNGITPGECVCAKVTVVVVVVVA